MDVSFDEQEVIMSCRFALRFWKEETMQTQWAIIGMMVVVEGYPLYCGMKRTWVGLPGIQQCQLRDCQDLWCGGGDVIDL